MTRVAGIPEDLQSLAATLVGSAPELDLAGAMLARAASALPSMPAGVAGQVETSLQQAQRLLAQSAATAQKEGSDLRRRGLWLEIADRIRKAWEPVAAPFGMLSTPNDAVNATSLWRVHRLLKVWDAYDRAVTPAVAAEGESSLAALNAQLSFEERNPMSPARFATVLEGAGEDGAYLESLGSFAEVAGTIGKFTPVGGVVGGVVELALPTHRHGALMVADRASGFGTLAGSGILLADAAGMALMPGLVPVALGVVVAAGVWELYENRQAVARITVAGGKFLLGHAYVLAGPAGIAAKELYDYRRPLAHALVSTADTSAQLAENGAKTILGGAENAGASAVSTAKSLLGHVGVHVPHFP